MTIRLKYVFVFFIFSCVGWGGEQVTELSPGEEEALRKLNLPGIKLNLKERCIDVNATVCLHEGLLELVACTKGSKEHESILSIAARPMHIHAAMLLIGAKPGTPAMRKARDEARTRWVSVEPAGDPIGVSLVFPDSKGKPQEHPISKFISPAQPDEIGGVPAKKSWRHSLQVFFSPVPIWWRTGLDPKSMFVNKVETSFPFRLSAMSCSVCPGFMGTRTMGFPGR